MKKKSNEKDDDGGRQSAFARDLSVNKIRDREKEDILLPQINTMLNTHSIHTPLSTNIAQYLLNFLNARPRSMIAGSGAQRILIEAVTANAIVTTHSRES